MASLMVGGSFWNSETRSSIECGGVDDWLKNALACSCNWEAMMDQHSLEARG